MRSSLLLVLLSALMDGSFSRLHEFVNVPVAKNWTDAQSHCRQRYTDLPTIDDQADHSALLETAGPGNVWIGLYRTRVPGDFVWSDQSSSTFRAWKSGQPDGQLCANVFSGQWWDRNCVDYVPFACYFDRKRQIVRLELKSSQSVKDPAVMDMILVKVQQILKEHGLSQFANLYWRTQVDGSVLQKTPRKSEATQQPCVSK